MGNLLSEESFGVTSHQQQSRRSLQQFDDDNEDRHYNFSPDDPTLQNLDTLELDGSPRRDHLPSEDQQPFENDTREPDLSAPVFSQLSGNSSPTSDDGIGTEPSPPRQVGSNQANVDQILHELSMTDQEDHDRGNQQPLMSLPQIPRPIEQQLQQQPPRHEEAFAPHLNGYRGITGSLGNEPDILPSRVMTHTSPRNNETLDLGNDDHMSTEARSVLRSRRRSSDDLQNRAFRRSRSLSGSKKGDSGV